MPSIGISLELLPPMSADLLTFGKDHFSEWREEEGSLR